MACSSLEEEEKRGKIIMEYNMQFFFACLCKYYLLMGVPVLSGREVNRKKPKFAYFGKCHWEIIMVWARFFGLFLSQFWMGFFEK